jgi:pyridoxine 5-phosphate synthase
MVLRKSKTIISLGVNVDHVATVRQARLGTYPVPLEIALLAENAGANSITIHLREDRRHIQLKDVLDMQKYLTTKLNLEMAVDDEVVDIACDVMPHDVCLVPEKRQELTTEGGLDVITNQQKLSKVIQRLKDKKIVVSLFVDPTKEQILASKDLGADAVEIHTGKYADAKTDAERLAELKIITAVSETVLEKGLFLNAGHGLNYVNVKDIAKIHGMNELNIGHSIISYALYVGIERAVREMKTKINSPSLEGVPIGRGSS